MNIQTLVAACGAFMNQFSKMFVSVHFSRGGPWNAFAFLLETSSCQYWANLRERVRLTSPSGSIDRSLFLFVYLFSVWMVFFKTSSRKWGGEQDEVCMQWVQGQRWRAKTIECFLFSTLECKWWLNRLFQLTLYLFPTNFQHWTPVTFIHWTLVALWYRTVSHKPLVPVILSTQEQNSNQQKQQTFRDEIFLAVFCHLVHYDVCISTLKTLPDAAVPRAW